MNELEQASVVPEDFLEKVVGFQRHRVFEQGIELGIQGRVRIGRLHVSQVEPLASEVLGEGSRPRVVEHPIDLGAQGRRVAQLAFFRQIEELLIGHRRPQEVGQARGQLEVAEPARGQFEIQKLRAAQDGGQGDAQGFVKPVSPGQPAAHQGHEWFQLGVADRPAKRPGGKPPQDALGVGQGAAVWVNLAH
jgi:hypothetical protein